MGVSRRNRPLFKFIRTFNSDLFGNLISVTRRLKQVELLDFAPLGLGAEFWRLIAGFRRDRKSSSRLKKSVEQVRSRCYGRQLRKRYGLRSYFVRAMVLICKCSALGGLPILINRSVVNKQEKKSFIYGGLGRGGLKRNREDIFGTPSVLGTARFVVRLLGFCVNETRFAVWLAQKFSGILLGMLRVLSNVWRSFLANIICKSLYSGVFLLQQHRSLRVRKLFLSRELRFSKDDGESRVVKSLVKLNSVSSTKTSFALQKKSRLSLDRSGGVSEESELRLFGLRQKMRRFWGNLTTRQLWQHRKRASIKLRGLWERYALGLFECRLDVFLVRSGFFRTVNEARYFVKVGLILVNGRVLTCYRYVVGEGDLLQVWPAVLRKFQLVYLREFWFALLEEGNIRFRVAPSYLEWSFRRLATCFVVGRFTVVALPQFIKFNTVYSVNCGRFQF